MRSCVQSSQRSSGANQTGYVYNMKMKLDSIDAVIQRLILSHKIIKIIFLQVLHRPEWGQ